VNIDPKKGKDLAPERRCYMIRPLARNEVVFDVPSPGATRSVAEAWVKDLSDHVSETTIKTALSHLVSFNTRYSTSADYVSAAAWVMQELAVMGDSTRQEEISVGTGNVDGNQT
jgi:hypothetical protein